MERGGKTRFTIRNIRNQSSKLIHQNLVLRWKELEHRDKYPSMDSMSGSTAKKEPNVYTGTLIKGIATMHKSNAVPVMNQKQAEEISKMGR